MTEIVVWGEVLWDRFPDGDQLGGAPANVAWHLAQLGTRVALVSRVGDDADGRAARDALAARGVDTSLIQIDGERATGEVRVEVEDGEPRYRLVAGRAWEAIDYRPAAAAALAGARALVFGTLAQRHEPARRALAAALAAAPPALLRVCDPNLRPPPPGQPARGDVDAALVAALAAADVVKLGERERRWCHERLGVDPVAWLVGDAPGPRPRARPAALVAVTRGADGSTWLAPGRALEVGAAAARTGGDNVGCGDAFVAGLVHGAIRAWPWPRCAALAAGLAAEVASVRGATPVIDPAVIARLVAASSAPDASAAEVS